MTGKKRDGSKLAACLGEIDGAESDLIAEVMAEFGLTQMCDEPPQTSGESVSPQSSQMGKRKAGFMPLPRSRKNQME